MRDISLELTSAPYGAIVIDNLFITIIGINKYCHIQVSFYPVDLHRYVMGKQYPSCHPCGAADLIEPSPVPAWNMLKERV